MAKNRIIFFSIFATYHLAALVFTMMIDADAGLLFSIVQYISWFKYGALLGFALLVIDFIWSWRISKENKVNEEIARKENNVLKAKVYDFQQAAKSNPADPTKN